MDESGRAPVEREASGTAVGVALLRAAHQLIDGEPRILDDPVSPRLFDAAVLDGIRADPGRLRAPGALALRSHVLVRSRYAEDRFQAAAARGVRQYVALGAGLDTFAFRQPGWARGAVFFEVDHPASQRHKRERLAAAGVETPPNVRFVGHDLDAGAPGDALHAAGFAAHEPAFVSMLGVTMYLSPQAVDAVLAWAAGLAKGSEMVFTFSRPPAPGDDDTLAERAAALGEPWRTRIGHEQLQERFAELGFARWEFASAGLLAERYFRDRTDDLPAPRRSAMVVVEV
jgi:methyltransferase (TIGR00027 family)